MTDDPQILIEDFDMSVLEYSPFGRALMDMIAEVSEPYLRKLATRPLFDEVGAIVDRRAREILELFGLPVPTEENTVVWMVWDGARGRIDCHVSPDIEPYMWVASPRFSYKSELD